MEKKYLNDSGLMRFWGKIKSYTKSVSDALQGQIDDNQQQITANKSAQDTKNASLDENMKKLNTRDDQITETLKNITVTGGASVASAVTYDNTTSQLTSANIQGAVDELQGSKIDKTSILQESGDAEDKVMSQKATTTAIADETTRAKAAEEAIIFDVSAHNNGAVFESLSALLGNANLSILIPTSVRRGGMTIRFIQGSVQSSDNNYVQYRLMTQTFSTTESDWQGVDSKPTAGSENLVKSGGVFEKTSILEGKVYFGTQAKDTILFTTDDLNVGDVLCPTYEGNSSIGVYDSNDTRIAATTSGGSIYLPSNFSYVKVIYGTGVTNLVIAIDKCDILLMRKDMAAMSFDSFTNNINANKVIRELYISGVDVTLINKIAFNNDRGTNHTCSVSIYVDGYNNPFTLETANYSSSEATAQHWKNVKYREYSDGTLGNIKFGILVDSSALPTGLKEFFCRLNANVANIDFSPSIKSIKDNIFGNYLSKTDAEKIQVRKNFNIVYNVEYESIDGYFINASGSPVSEPNYTYYKVYIPQSTYRYQYAHFYQSVPNSAGAVHICFFTSENTLILRRVQKDLGINKQVEIEIPDGTSYFYVNTHNSYNNAINISLSNHIPIDGNPLSLLNKIIGSFHLEGCPANYRNDLDYTIDADKIQINEVVTAGYEIYFGLNTSKGLINGHKYYFSELMRSHDSSDGIAITYNQGDNYFVQKKHSGNGAEERLSLTVTYDNSIAENVEFNPLRTSNTGTRLDTYIKNMIILDLTGIFGAGKEPDAYIMDMILGKYNIRNINNVIPTVIEPSVADITSVLGLENNILEIKKQIGINYDNSVTQVVSPSMGKSAFVNAYNASLDNYATLCKCNRNSFFNLLGHNMTWETIYKVINANFRKRVVYKEQSFEDMCAAINEAFTKPILRFMDAKVNNGMTNDFSLTIPTANLQEPSAIISDDGSTLYVYGRLMRVSTKDGVNWTNAENLVLSGGPSYVMHVGINKIDDVYYLIGCEFNSGGGLYLYTSTDGLAFTYQGKIFDTGLSLPDGYTVLDWGNPYLIKEYGSNKFYLYIELNTNDANSGWIVYIATCDDILHDNGNGTIGDWVLNSHIPLNGNILSDFGITRTSPGNPDFIKGEDNRPIKCNNRYYMYYHTNHGSSGSLICRAYSEDLINWKSEACLFNNRDIPTDGATTNGNADHCIIQFKGRTYLFYTWDVNSTHTKFVKYTIDDRPLHELLKIFP